MLIFASSLIFQSDVEKKIKGVLEPLSLFTTYGDEEGKEDESHVPVYHHVTDSWTF